MKVKFNVDSGANIHSINDSGWLDTVKELGMEEGEWEKMSDDDKYTELKYWVDEQVDSWYEEEEE